MKKTLYITQETQDRLARLGGPTPSENLRRAVALAEVAGEVASALERCKASLAKGAGTMGSINEAREALAKYKEAKQ